MRQAVRFSKRYIRPRAILAAVGFSVICWACPSRLEFTDNATLQAVRGITSGLPVNRESKAFGWQEYQSRTCETDSGWGTSRPAMRRSCPKIGFRKKPCFASNDSKRQLKTSAIKHKASGLRRFPLALHNDPFAFPGPRWHCHCDGSKRFVAK